MLRHMKNLLAAVLLLLCSAHASAWGRQGHRLVGLVAEEHLSPIARENVHALLHTETLADVASWADAYRPLETQTGLWHYVNIPAGAGTYDRDRDCPVQPGVTLGAPNDVWRDCVVDRILFFETRVADTHLDPPDRAIALKYLVHLVGDLHQPLHTYGPFQGGNGITTVTFGATVCGKYPCSLHSAWDSGLIEHRGLSTGAYDALLEKEIAATHETAGTADPAAWAAESNAAVAAALLPVGGAVDEAYYTREIPVVDHQLELAGLHLAAVLNRLFTAAPQPFVPSPEVP